MQKFIKFLKEIQYFTCDLIKRLSSIDEVSQIGVESMSGITAKPVRLVNLGRAIVESVEKHRATLSPAERKRLEIREERLAKETHKPEPMGGG